MESFIDLLALASLVIVIIAVYQRFSGKIIMKNAGWIALGLFLLVFFWSYHNNMPEQQNNSGPSNSDVYSMAQSFVKDRLRSPSTAKFPWSSEDYSVAVDKKDKNLYLVQSYVDAQNSFGATIRNRYFVLMRYNPTREVWNLDNIRIH